MIIISNSPKKGYNEKVDFDFRSFSNIIYEIKNDSLYVYLTNYNEFEEKNRL